MGAQRRKNNTAAKLGRRSSGQQFMFPRMSPGLHFLMQLLSFRHWSFSDNRLWQIVTRALRFAVWHCRHKLLGSPFSGMGVVLNVEPESLAWLYCLPRRGSPFRITIGFTHSLHVWCHPVRENEGLQGRHCCRGDTAIVRGFARDIVRLRNVRF